MTVAGGLAAGSLLGAGGCGRKAGDKEVVRIVSSLPRTGSAKGQTNTIVNGIQMAIDEYGGEVAGMRVEYSDWDDATAAAGQWAAEAEKANAQKAAADPDVMAFIGPYNSGAAKVSMIELNEAGLVQVSPACTWPGLTKKIDGVAPDSQTETYAAMRLDIDNWRWAGVPFFIRTGKKLPTTQTELRLVFKHPPRLGFWDESHRPEANQLVVKLDPSTGVRLIVDARRARTAAPEPIELDMEFAEEGGEGAAPYEVLLHAAMIGDSKRFTRQDGVEEAWRVMQPLLDAPPPVQAYAPGSWGPKAADKLISGHGRWHDPWVPS